tara:strand:- start:1366 stop:1836 length:471 start_codon:yes stop_codon:yes gene_type:complete
MSNITLKEAITRIKSHNTLENDSKWLIEKLYQTVENQRQYKAKWLNTCEAQYIGQRELVKANGGMTNPDYEKALVNKKLAMQGFKELIELRDEFDKHRTPELAQRVKHEPITLKESDKDNKVFGAETDKMLVDTAIAEAQSLIEERTKIESEVTSK